MAYGPPPTRDPLHPPRSYMPYGTAGAYATEGVLSRRLFAYIVDLVAVGLLTVAISFVIALLGVLTFGLGWGLFALLPLTAFVYAAVTIGGPAQATIGMRMMGLRVVDAQTGGRVNGLTAAVHALLFYVAASTFVLWLLDLLIGFVRRDGRLGHDLLVNFTLVRIS